MDKAMKKKLYYAASLTLVCMFIYLPDNKMVGDHVAGFEYRFLWDLGELDNNIFVFFLPNVPFILTEIIGLLVLSFFVSKLIDK